MVERRGTLVVRRIPARHRSEPRTTEQSTIPVSRRNDLWSATIRGEPVPQTRLHDVVLTDGVARLVRSRPARLWQNRALPQLLNRRPTRPLATDLALDCRFWSAAPLPPIDESVVIELLERAAIIAHGRQIREKHVFVAADRDDPRVTVSLARAEPRS